MRNIIIYCSVYFKITQVLSTTRRYCLNPKKSLLFKQKNVIDRKCAGHLPRKLNDSFGVYKILCRTRAVFNFFFYYANDADIFRYGENCNRISVVGLLYWNKFKSKGEIAPPTFIKKFTMIRVDTFIVYNIYLNQQGRYTFTFVSYFKYYIYYVHSSDGFDFVLPATSVLTLRRVYFGKSV